MMTAVRRFVCWASVASVVAFAAAAGEDVTVRGCIERDAAASTVIYKLIVPPPTVPRIYRLTAPKDLDLSIHVGSTVEVTGSVDAPAPGRGARQEPSLTITKLTVIQKSCAAPLARP